MAADTQGEIDDAVKVTDLVKIIRAQGHLIGFAGNDVPPVKKMVDWFFAADGEKSKMVGFKFDLLVVAPDGEISVWDERGTCEPVRQQFFAIGCGAPCALAAMEVGASARRAVAAAIKWAPGCGGKVVTRHL